MEQQHMMQMQMLQQEAQEMNQQLQLIEQNISEMQELKSSLEEIEKDKNKEILANIGKRIYLPVEIKDKNLFVEVGKGNFVKKSVPEAKKVVDEQIKKLIIGKTDITKRLEELQQEVNNLMQELIKAQANGEDKKKE
tara:strand:- start:394 stop:804 length:411 start_codon:yes stop_codon:yes gene_type:complete